MRNAVVENAAMAHGTMTRTAVRKAAIALVVLGLVACGGDDDGAAEPAVVGDDAGSGGDDAGSDDAGSSGGGEIANPQPAGQAFVSVDGLEYTMQEPGGVACTIDDEAITYAFRIGDNEVTLGAGANLYDTGWLGNISLRIANPTGQDGPVTYFPDLAVDGDGLVVDGASSSYSGPMMKQPPNDGSNPPPVEVGDGVISVTCP